MEKRNVFIDFICEIQNKEVHLYFRSGESPLFFSKKTYKIKQLKQKL